MRSVVLDFERRLLLEQELPEPHLQTPSDIRFRIHEVGVCGTDRELAAFRMRPRERDARRIAIGHEALGQVLECGSAVRGLAPGDWVVPTVRRACKPPCSSCARGRSDLCRTFEYSERGIFNLDGYFTEFAVDDESYLVRIPEALVPFAVLLEPLSIVEKCAARIEALRQTDGRDALVLGLGPVGMLAAMVLGLRGYSVTVLSLEPEDHPRVALLARAGVRYTRSLSGRWDVIVEAAGSAPLALAAVKYLGSCGVFVTLGAQRTTGEISFIDLIVGNQTIAGIVNASRGAFEDGVRDLAALPGSALEGMIRRFGFSDYRRTLLEPAAGEPKCVHVIADSLH
jgi:threonine dehydrogenase-like Zn-dependent dehydrogenase